MKDIRECFSNSKSITEYINENVLYQELDLQTNTKQAIDKIREEGKVKPLGHIKYTC